MCVVFSWVAFGLAASGGLADSAPSSYSDFVKSFSACGQPCMDTLYNKVVGDSCGDGAKSSTGPSDIKCICTAGGFQGATSYAGDAGECYAKKCGSDNMSSLADNMSGFIELCRKASGGSGSSSGSSSESESSPSGSGSYSESDSDDNDDDDNAASSWRNAPSVTGVSAFLAALLLV